MYVTKHCLDTCLRYCLKTSLRCLPCRVSGAATHTRCAGVLTSRNNRLRPGAPYTRTNLLSSLKESEPKVLARMAAVEQDSAAAAAAHAQPDPIVQYIVLRRDLWSEMKWPLGSVVAQACHAATAATLAHVTDPHVVAYTHPDNIDHMHKVVLEVKGEAQLRSLADKLSEAGIMHKLWIEQPENYATCLATKPAPKSALAPLLKKYPLCKAALG